LPEKKEYPNKTTKNQTVMVMEPPLHQLVFQRVFQLHLAFFARPANVTGWL